MRWCLFTGCLLMSSAIASAQQGDLSAEIVAAWQKEGASPGWMGSTRRNFQVFSERREWLDGPDGIPAFAITKWRPGMLKALPMPTVPFGLSFRDTDFDDDGLKELANFTHLTSLSLLNTKITDAGMAELARLKKLSTLNLDGTAVTAKALKKLASLKKLTALAVPERKKEPGVSLLDARDATDATLWSLREIGLLHAITWARSANDRRPTKAEEVVSLDLADTLVTDTGMEVLADLPNLTFLGLRGTKVTDAGMKDVAKLKRLASLNLFGTRVTVLGLKELGGLKQLSTLVIGFDRPGNDSGVYDRSLEVLRDINLLHALVNAQGPNGVRPASLEDVTSLFLTGDWVTDAGLKYLVGMKRLQSLDLSGSGVTYHGLGQLAGLRQLTTLTLDLKVINDEAVMTLREIDLLHALSLARSSDGGRAANPAKVASLDLSDTRITGKGLKVVAHFPHLTSLDLSNTLVTDEGLKELANVPRLASLDLSKTTQISFVGLRELPENLAILNLEGAGTTNVELMELRRLKRLESLNARNTHVTDVGLKGLANMTELTSLDLQFTDITDAGLKHLAGLKKLGTLNLGRKHIDIVSASVSEIGHSGDLRLMDGGMKELAGLKQLTSLNLDGWDISDAGLRHLARLDQLLSLDVSRTFVTADGIARLQKAFPNLTVKAKPLRIRVVPYQEESAWNYKIALLAVGILVLILIVIQAYRFRRWRLARDQRDQPARTT